MTNPKFYRLAGWGMIISSFYFTWWLFLAAGVVLYNLVTNGGFLTASTTIVHREITSELSISPMFVLQVLIGPVLLAGGIFVLKRMATNKRGIT